MSEFLFGADPEFFLRSKKTGQFVSAAGLFPGTKTEPYRLDQGAVQVDGLALEFNIDPTSCPKEFEERIFYVANQIEGMITEVSTDLESVYVPYAEFDAQYFNNLDDECKILGCDPDFSIDGRPNNPPIELMHRPIRTAAGHIHIGWTSGANEHEATHMEDCRFISSFFRQVDGDYSPENRKRQKYYGNTGAFRPKSYGVELRCPSNAWVNTKGRPSEIITYISKAMSNL